jgi:GxxExxY protein
MDMITEAESLLMGSDGSHTVIGAFYDTYNELGPGFPELVMRKALAVVIREKGLEVYEEVEVPVWFHGARLAKFKVDLVVASKLIVEVKVSQEIERFHMAQVLHYLKATHFEVGLLVNFGRKPEFKRVVYQTSRAREHHEPPAAEEARTRAVSYPSDPPP